MRDKSGAVALIVETPDCTSLGRLEIFLAPHRAGVDKIGHGVETLDGKPGKTVNDHPFGGDGAGPQHQEGLREKRCQQGDRGYSGAKRRP
jgi:hypothetical protein